MSPTLTQIRAGLLGLGVGLVVAVAAWLQGRASAQAHVQDPVVIRVGHARPRPEVDLSPPGVPRSVVVAAVRSGVPQRPPVVPPASVLPEGTPPATTLSVPATSATPDFTLHASLYPLVLDERRIGFRTVLWGKDAQGDPLRIGDAVQVDGPGTVVTLPPPPRPSAWRVGALVYPEGGRAQWGGVVSYQRPGSSWGAVAVGMKDRLAIGITVGF